MANLAAKLLLQFAFIKYLVFIALEATCKVLECQSRDILEYKSDEDS
ncbi:hypothetical protein [Bacillus paramycoides]|nr:hypothetical protein [Bacillus paramycoides]